MFLKRNNIYLKNLVKNSDVFRLDVLVKSSVGRSEVSLLQVCWGVLTFTKILFIAWSICVEVEIVMNTQIR